MLRHPGTELTIEFQALPHCENETTLAIETGTKTANDPLVQEAAPAAQSDGRAESRDLQAQSILIAMSLVGVAIVTRARLQKALLTNETLAETVIGTAAREMMRKFAERVALVVVEETGAETAAIGREAEVAVQRDVRGTQEENEAEVREVEVAIEIGVIGIDVAEAEAGIVIGTEREVQVEGAEETESREENELRIRDVYDY